MGLWRGARDLRQGSGSRVNSPLTFHVVALPDTRERVGHLAIFNQRSSTMNQLEHILKMAQRDADRTHRTMLVLNLNKFQPLYVVREWSQKARDSQDFVCEVEPSMYR